MRKKQTKNSNKRRYNKKFYNVFKKGNAYVRDKMTPDPLNQLNECGIWGRVVNKIGNEIIKTPIHKLTRNIVGNIYDPKTEKPYKGSILYTITKIFVCFVVSMFLFGIINVLGIFR